MRRLLLVGIFLLLQAVPVLAYYHHESPIRWRDYNQESFDSAAKENKPAFMLITASWCYWCHVYRDETLHQPDVSSYLNEHFIPIFVDADKRQDLTRQYLAGGWPSTVIFSPAGQEVNRINGMIRKEDLLNHLQKVVSYFATNGTYSKEERKVDELSASSATQQQLDEAWDAAPLKLLHSYDKDYGGFGADRKFPLGRVYEFFLYRYQQTQEPVLLEATELALKNMAPERYLDTEQPIEERVFQGIADPIEGGFFRYDTRRDWSVPHYEKMLDTNAYIIRAYLLAYNATRNQRYRELAEHGLAYVMNTLQDAETGRFYGSQDAGHERYYRQTPEERRQETYESRPRVDTTTYADWSGPMISTFLVAADVLRNETYADRASDAVEFVESQMLGDEGVSHFYDGKAQLNGLLLDNAEIASALLDAYESTEDETHAAAAEKILAFADQRLYNSTAGAYHERKSTDTHLYRAGDEFLPVLTVEGNTAIARALAKAHRSTGKQEYLDRARTVMGFLLRNQDPGLEELAVQAMIADHLRKQPISLEFEQTALRGNLIILLAIALLAGLLSFLSPCTLPLLPAFAVHMLKAEHDALKRTIAFVAGLGLVFSALGVSVALVGRLLTSFIPQMSRLAGGIIILFGVLTLFGKGFSGFRLGRAHDGVAGSFLFGASYGIAWTPCVGPILGSIMLIAATSGSWAGGGLLLLAYAFGIAIPLLAVSHYVDALRHDGKVWTLLHGKALTFRIGRWEFHTHTTNIIAGILLIVIGSLMFTGTLYLLSKLALQTAFQKRLFGLEDVLLRSIT